MKQVIKTLLTAFVEPEFTIADIAILNSVNISDLQDKIQRLVFGVHKNPEVLYKDTSTGIVLQDRTGSLPQVKPVHYLSFESSVQTNISFKLDAEYNPKYYYSPSVLIRKRGTHRQRFDSSSIVFNNGVLSAIEFDPESNEFSVSIKEKIISFVIPEDMSTFVNSTDISTEIFQMFWDFKNKKYGRSKMPRFFINTESFDLNKFSQYYNTEIYK